MRSFMRMSKQSCLASLLKSLNQYLDLAEVLINTWNESPMSKLSTIRFPQMYQRCDNIQELECRSVGGVLYFTPENKIKA